MGNKSKYKKILKKHAMQIRREIPRKIKESQLWKKRKQDALLEEVWISCQADVNKLVQNNGNEPLFSPEESVWPEEGDTVVGDAPPDEGIDTKNIILIKPVDVVEEEFILEEKKTVQKTEYDEKKDFISTDWVIHKFLCRCCHAEGDFSSFLTETHENKSYEELLKTCFNIKFHPVEGYAGADALRALCGLCVARLQDAFAFSRQVKAAEERFRELFTDNCIKVGSAIEIEVKEEKSDDFDDMGLYANEVTSNELLVEDNSKRKKTDQKQQTNKPKPKPKSKSRKKAGYKKKEFRSSKFYTRIGASSFKCSRCEQIFQEISELKVHYKTHRKLKCGHCPMEFITPGRRTSHLFMEHNIDERYKCNACNKYFNMKYHLVRHLNVFHMLGEKIKCSMCDFECYNKNSLHKHVVKHATSKEFQCKFCKKAFLRRTTLTFHERIHTGDKRKTCNECGEAFVQKASLNYHMAKYHPAVKF